MCGYRSVPTDVLVDNFPVFNALYMPVALRIGSVHFQARCGKRQSNVAFVLYVYFVSYR